LLTIWATVRFSRTTLLHRVCITYLNSGWKTLNTEITQQAWGGGGVYWRIILKCNHKKMCFWRCWFD
jgi:hypothetical protein